MTDPELDVALRALTEIDADPMLAARVLARAGLAARTTTLVPWLAAAAAALLLAVSAAWYAGRPVTPPPIPAMALLASSVPASVPRIPEAALAKQPATPPIVPVSFTRGLGRQHDLAWPYRIRAIDRTPPLAIAPLEDAPLPGTRLDIAPLEIVELEIASLDER